MSYQLSVPPQEQVFISPLVMMVVLGSIAGLVLPPRKRCLPYTHMDCSNGKWKHRKEPTLGNRNIIISPLTSQARDAAMIPRNSAFAFSHAVLRILPLAWMGRSSGGLQASRN